VLLSHLVARQGDSPTAQSMLHSVNHKNTISTTDEMAARISYFAATLSDESQKMAAHGAFLPVNDEKSAENFKCKPAVYHSSSKNGKKQLLTVNPSGRQTDFGGRN
jgi:hypothetical protein